MTRTVWVVVWGEGNNFCSVFPSDQTLIFKNNILLNGGILSLRELKRMEFCVAYLLKACSSSEEREYLS